MQAKGRVHDDDAIDKMLNDLALIKKFEQCLSLLLFHMTMKGAVFMAMQFRTSFGSVFCNIRNLTAKQAVFEQPPTSNRVCGSYMDVVD